MDEIKWIKNKICIIVTKDKDTIEAELINKQLFDNYINYLESKSDELKEVIESLYKFKKRINL